MKTGFKEFMAEQRWRNDRRYFGGLFHGIAVGFWGTIGIGIYIGWGPLSKHISIYLSMSAYFIFMLLILLGHIFLGKPPPNNDKE